MNTINSQAQFFFDRYNDLHDYLSSNDISLQYTLEMFGVVGFEEYIKSDVAKEEEVKFIERFKDIYDYNGFILDLKEHADREAAGEFDQ